MAYGEFPATLVIAPSSDVRRTREVRVESWEEVKNIQRQRYEIIEWK